MIVTVTHDMRGRELDIARIQCNHFEKETDGVNGIYFIGLPEWVAGAGLIEHVRAAFSTAVNNSLIEKPYQINRVNESIAGIRIGTGNSTKSILNTHAPHAQYGKGEIGNYREMVGERIVEVPNSMIAI